MADKRIFLSYAKEDTLAVRRFYEIAQRQGFNVFMDVHGLRPGLWKPQLQRKIARSNVFILFLSRNVRQKLDRSIGFIEEEIDFAYTIATNASQSDFHIIPVRLDDDYRGDFRISLYQQYDLFDDFESQANTILSHIEESSPVQRLIERAATFFAARDYLNAYGMICCIEQIVGQNEDIIVNKVVLLHNVGRSDEAIRLLEVLCGSRPDLGSEPSWLLANLLSVQGRRTQALQVLDGILALHPQFHQAKAMRSRMKDASPAMPVAAFSEQATHFIGCPIIGIVFFSDGVSTFSDPWGIHHSFSILPNRNPFFKIGSIIEIGQIYALVYIMGGLNEYKAERRFRVKAQLVHDGEAIGYNQNILEVEYLS